MSRTRAALRSGPLAALALCAAGAAAFAEEPVGMVYVKSDPAGAQVFLDDGSSPVGRTPCLLRDIPPGRHSLRGKLDSGQELRAEVFVQAGSLAKVELKPVGEAPAQGELQVSTTPPGATVWLDGVERGKTPLALAGIPVGEREIRVELEGYSSVVRKLTIAAGSNGLELTLASADSPPAAEPAAPGPTPEAAVGRPAKKETVPRTIEVDCPACKGSGLCKEMGCPSCRADGHIGTELCPTCSGSGRVTYKCPSCQGLGKVVVGGKEYDCRACLGKGAPPCPMCKGKGKIPRPNPEAAGAPTKPCIACDGTGFEQGAKCLACSGTGDMTSSENEGLIRWFVRFKCPFCGGDGKGQPLCPQCRGRGYQGPDKAPYPCPNCAGTGRLFLPCNSCGGRGFIIDRKAGQ